MKHSTLFGIIHYIPIILMAHIVNLRMIMIKRCLKWLKIFNKYDLYTKTDNIVTESVKDYYNDLIINYMKDGELWI